jgi:peroxiredoxin
MDTLTCAVVAIDFDGDSLGYLWTSNGDCVSTSQNYLITEFSNAGVDTIVVGVSDNDTTVTHQWIVTIENISTEVTDDEADVPEFFGLFQNYPNPFNSEPTIRYQACVSTNVIIRIYNSLGQEVKTLVSITRLARRSRPW